MVGLLLVSSTSSLAVDNVFEIERVADGVYAAIAKPTFRLNCNAAIILMGDGVLVVDSESIPSAAREVIAEIKRITDKPVKYVVITHFHGDHFQGAEAYASTWPGVQFISSDATRESILKRGIPRIKGEILDLPGRIDKIKVELAQVSDKKQKEQIQQRLDQAEAYLAELKSIGLVLPTQTVDHDLRIYGTTRTVEILWLGRGHTDGDLFVYVPDAKVIVSGDALHSGTPTLTDASPYDWIRTLDLVEKLDFDYVIGGHGDVMRGKETFELWKEYFTYLMANAVNACAEGKTLDEARKTLAPTLIAKYGTRFGNIPAPFARTVDANIDRAFRVVSGPRVQ
jgi:glyoxylase-like metal-dependent hydrolase (beta-lactamase superfamily II)